MNKPSFCKSVVCAAVFWAATSAAHAALTPIAPACSASISNPTWSDCAGAFSGNDKNQQADVLATILTQFGLAGVSFQGASDDVGNGPFTSNPGGLSGTLSFDSSIDGPFVLSLKAGNAFSLFYFDGAGAPISSIDFNTQGVSVNSNEVGNGLSHASVYATQLVPGIPEPQTLALMLAGLAAFGFLAARRGPR
jgi:hypothetical protein